MKINGLPVWGIIAGTVAFFFWGFLVFGVLFTDAWLAANGLAADMEPGDDQGLWMGLGFLQTFVTVIGLALLLKWRGWPTIPGAIGTALIASICFAVMVTGYDLIYLPDHSWSAFFIDCFHLIIGWIIASVVITLLK